MFISPLIKGFAIGIGLITAIGAQNAFVLKQGLKLEHRFACAMTCALIDATLITLGVAGLGLLVQTHPFFLQTIRWLGILFLVVYGFQAFMSAANKQSLTIDDGITKYQATKTLKSTLIILLSLSLLNPHVYLDAVIMLGSIGARYQHFDKVEYIVGASMASFVWFFSLAYFSKVLRPLFKKSIAWKILDILTGFVMWFIAGSLLFMY